jgi:HEAT repeat protein
VRTVFCASWTALTSSNSRNSSVRKKALGRLISSKDPRVVDALIRLAKDPDDREIQIAALRELPDRGDPKAIQPLTDLMGNDLDEEIRERAAASLRTLRESLGAVPPQSPGPK